MTLTEDKVKNAVVAYLTRKDFKGIKIKTGTEKGPDITAEFVSSHRRMLIEAKGDPSSDYKKPGQGHQAYFLQGLGQLLTRVQARSTYEVYGLAYPSSYRPLFLRRIDPYLLKVLRTELFFVGENREVQRLNWSQFKHLREQELRRDKGKTTKAKAEGKLSILDAAAKVLARAAKPMQCGDIIKVALAKGYWVTRGKTPAATLSAAINREIAANGEASRFRRAEVNATRGEKAVILRGHFALRNSS